MRVWEPARARALAEQKDLEALAAGEGFKAPLMGWDWNFYAEKLRQERYKLDEAELKPYFQLDRMTAAMFDAAGRLYGISFKEVKGVPLYHPDARLYEVLDAETKAITGIFIADSFARSTKRGGAWMNDFRGQSRNRQSGLLYPIVINNNNFAKAPDGKPTLLSLDDVRTLFHEFGHGLHGLLSEALGADARDPQEARRTRSDRQTDKRQPDCPHQEERALQPGLPDRRLYLVCPHRHGSAPASRS